MFSAIREFLSSLKALVLGYVKHLFARGARMEKEEFCHVCQALDKPLQTGRYLILTGPRKGVLATDHPTEFLVFVCNKHHPDEHLAGADWAGETQEHLRKMESSARCVLMHNHTRQ